MRSGRSPRGVRSDSQGIGAPPPRACASPRKRPCSAGGSTRRSRWRIHRTRRRHRARTRTRLRRKGCAVYRLPRETRSPRRGCSSDHRGRGRRSRAVGSVPGLGSAQRTQPGRRGRKTPKRLADTGARPRAHCNIRGAVAAKAMVAILTSRYELTLAAPGDSRPNRPRGLQPACALHVGGPRRRDAHPIRAAAGAEKPVAGESNLDRDRARPAESRPQDPEPRRVATASVEPRRFGRQCPTFRHQRQANLAHACTLTAYPGRQEESGSKPNRDSPPAP
jgi:hypothetical protein